MYTILLCIYADSRMIGPPRTPALGYEFLNKKLIRGSRRMDAVAAKSDAVTAWKCTATDAYRRLQTLTDAYRRWFPVRGFCSFRVWPCQSVPQCDWAFTTLNYFCLNRGDKSVFLNHNNVSVSLNIFEYTCVMGLRPSHKYHRSLGIKGTYLSLNRVSNMTLQCQEDVNTTYHR